VEPIFILSSILLWVLVLLNLVLTLALVRKANSDSSSGATSTSQPVETLEKGSIAPDFSAQNLQGETVTLASYEGRAVAFVFVGPNCAPCRDSLPRYEAMYAGALSRGTEVVLVSNAGSEATSHLVDEFNLRMPVLIAPQPDNPFFEDYKVAGTPSYCLITADGKVQSSGYPSFQRGEWKALAQAWETRKSDEPQAMSPVPSGGR
jgi:peroxiredoxin